MSIKILLADDSITIQKVIGIIFGSDEYSLTVVDNGKAAVEKALDIIPDILIIDALMPGMSGYEVCEQVRATPALAAKPILLLTGSFEPFDETKAKNCGADDFIAKPFESQQIIAKVTELCELSASRAFEAGQAETELPETPPALPAEEETVEHVEEPETIAQPQDIWEAFTPAEPVVEAPAAEEETVASQTVNEAEETVSTVWQPIEEEQTVFEEETEEIKPAAEAPQDEDLVFGDVAFEEAAEPVAVAEEPVKQEIAPEVATAVVPEVAAAKSGDLTEEQLRAAIAAVSKDVIERIVWEVVPDLAETLIKEAIRRIKDGQ